MRKYKLLTTIITAILSLILAIAIFLSVKCDFNLWDIGDETEAFTIKDTLPDGGGKKATVILLGGQSNAAGRSYDSYLQQNLTPEEYAEYEAGYDNIYINYYVSNRNNSEEFVRCGACQGEKGGQFGPELGIADKLNELYPDRTFFIIKYAWGGTNLHTQWRSPSSLGTTGDLYSAFVSYVSTSLKYLESKNYDIEIEAMCWMQGEADSKTVENATNYEKHLKNFIKDVRKEFAAYSSDDGIAFIDAYISPNEKIWVYHELINQSKKNVAATSPMNTVVDTITAGLTCATEPKENPDIAHYDAMSQLKLGWMFAEEVVKFFD